MQTTTATDTASLDQRESVLRDALKTAMLNGQAQDIIDTRNELATLPMQRKAVELQELRQRLEELKDRFAKNETEEAAMLEIRNEVRSRLEPALQLCADIGKEMSRCEFGLSLVYSERDGLVQERREARANIKRIVDEIEADVAVTSTAAPYVAGDAVGKRQGFFDEVTTNGIE